MESFQKVNMDFLRYFLTQTGNEASSTGWNYSIRGLLQHTSTPALQQSFCDVAIHANINTCFELLFVFIIPQQVRSQILCSEILYFFLNKSFSEHLVTYFKYSSCKNEHVDFWRELILPTMLNSPNSGKYGYCKACLVHTAVLPCGYDVCASSYTDRKPHVWNPQPSTQPKPIESLTQDSPDGNNAAAFNRHDSMLYAF